MGRWSGAALLAAGIVLLAGCRLDMHTQPKVLPLTQNDFFEDGRGSRSLVPGTIARGQLRADPYLYSGMVNGQPGNMLPDLATLGFKDQRTMLERGRERFNIYCSPCHSRIGDGNGMIVQRGFRHPPSFHTPTLRQAPLGHFYDVMTNGFGAMPDYAAQVPTRDRWAIAAYIRVLQLSQNATAADAQGMEMNSSATQPQSTPGSGATLPPGAAPNGEKPANRTGEKK